MHVSAEAGQLQLIPCIDKAISFEKNNFTFLNETQYFEDVTTGLLKIDWNFLKFGKLWAYNLNYMDYLLQPELDDLVATSLISQFIENISSNKVGLDPYPTSLRGINWIKAFSKTRIKDKKFDYSLRAQYTILYNNVEYHLLANHLLENGFSLLFGAFYFKDLRLFNKAQKIIIKELNEQILNDGAHFELSPMYHQIILDRLLDCINLTQNNTIFSKQGELLLVMIEKAKYMIKWLNAMTFSNGFIPLLNDSTNGISPSTSDLNAYAIRLGLFTKAQLNSLLVEPRQTILNESGYRRYNGFNYECIVDIGQVGPDYQPGHAHSDTFNFVMNINSCFFIVDTGISTYESNPIRLKERGSQAHNTVTINNQNSSQVWSSFRIGKRAKVTVLHDEDSFISASHNGYKDLGVIHFREWKFEDGFVKIHDRLEGNCNLGIATFIFSPSVKPLLVSNTIKTSQGVIFFENFEDVQLFQIKIPEGFNKFSDSWKLEITFNHWLKTTIQC